MTSTSNLVLPSQCYHITVADDVVFFTHTSASRLHCDMQHGAESVTECCSKQFMFIELSMECTSTNARMNRDSNAIYFFQHQWFWLHNKIIQWMFYASKPQLTTKVLTIDTHCSWINTHAPTAHSCSGAIEWDYINWMIFYVDFFWVYIAHLSVILLLLLLCAHVSFFILYAEICRIVRNILLLWLNTIIKIWIGRRSIEHKRIELKM